jgi:probable HAF family extracellular repeat protein
MPPIRSGFGGFASAGSAFGVNICRLERVLRERAVTVCLVSSNRRAVCPQDIAEGDFEMNRRTVRTALAACSLATLSLGNARAQTSYAFKDLGTMGGASITAYGVNSLGQAVGGYAPVGGTGYRVFLYLPAPAYGLPAGANDIGTLVSSIATSINDSGEVVGRDAHAFIWVASARYGLPAGMNDLNVLPQINAAGFVALSAYAINNNHVVSGTARSLTDNSPHGFAFDLDSGVYTDLGSTMTVGRSINNNPLPQVVGSQLMYNFVDNTYTSLAGYNPMGMNNAGGITATGLVGGSYHGFYRSPSGQWTDLGWLGYASARVNGINNAGVNPAVVVGYSYTSQLLAHAFRWRVGSSAMDDLNKISAGLGKFTLVEATAVGDSGDIVGYATISVKGSNVYHAFLLTPQ